MHSSPNRLSQNTSKKPKAAPKKPQSSAQHESATSTSHSHRHHQLTNADADAGASRPKSILQRIPFDTLLHITCYLSPPALANLSGVSSYFKEYLTDDVVWKLALFANVLDIRPERETDSTRAFLLRRIESTWKAEYIERFKALTRWSQSRTTSTAHHPLMIPVPNLHLLSDGESLLAAPEHFSWVFRTVPSTGKIYKGQFQPTLPNQAHPLNDWSPPTVGAIASDGNIAKIAWGSQAGDVMVKTAHILTDSKPIRRAPAVASSLEDRHIGIINSVSWATTAPKSAKPYAHATSTAWLITTAADGCVKIWNAECVAVWTSPHAPDGAPFIRAEYDLTTNTAVALSESGIVMAWVHLPIGNTDDAPNPDAEEIVTLVSSIPQETPARRIHTTTTKLLFDRAGSMPSIIVHAQEDHHAFRFQLDVTRQEMVGSKVVGPLGPITAMQLVVSRGTAGSESSILLVGDALSLLSIYDLGSKTLFQEDAPTIGNDEKPGISKTMTPNLTLTTHDYGAITAIATNGLVLVSGNELGVITVWDAVTLANVRTIDASSLVKSGVGIVTLLCQREQIIASVGNAVVHWRTGNVASRIKKQSKAGKMVSSKGKYRIDEYQRAIRDSQIELEMTSKRVPPVVYSEQEQRAALHALGLDESGAVEYALMVSHDEAARQGILDLDQDESVSVPLSPTGTSTSINTDLTTSTTPTSGGGASASAREDFISSSPWKSTSMSRLSPPNPQSIGKVQVSPPYRAEAMSVGLSELSRLGKRVSTGSMKSWSGSEEAFPRISPPSTKRGSGTSTPLISRGSTPPVQLKMPVPPPGKAAMKSWSTIVKSSTPSPSVSGAGTPGSKGVGVGGSKGSYSSRAGGAGRGAQDEDAQLQFALELSLAEAMGRQGDNQSPPAVRRAWIASWTRTEHPENRWEYGPMSIADGYQKPVWPSLLALRSRSGASLITAPGAPAQPHSSSIATTNQRPPSDIPAPESAVSAPWQPPAPPADRWDCELNKGVEDILHQFLREILPNAVNLNTSTGQYVLALGTIPLVLTQDAEFSVHYSGTRREHWAESPNEPFSVE